MTQTVEVKVPDIGDFKDVPVIEILIKPGDRVKAEDPLVTLESDKATMDVPAPAAGVVKALNVKLGDRVSEGSALLTLQSDVAAAATDMSFPPARPSVSPPPPEASAPAGVAEVRVPDIGDFKDVPVIEILVKPGDKVAAEQSLITLESDKATMDVPSPLSGVVQALKVKVGDKVSQGMVILTLSTDVARQTRTPTAERGGAKTLSETSSERQTTRSASAPGSELLSAEGAVLPYASPAVRQLARERGVDLTQIQGSGNKGRILKEDVEAFVAGSSSRVPARVSGQSASGALGELQLLPWPQVDFAKFGPIESKPLSRIKKIAGANLHRNWVAIPHVTNHDDADITELEAFRLELNKEYEKSGVKLTLLAFLVKAAVAALKKFPEFNASLEGENLVLKKYYHIGFAADTPNGLMVPVIKDADKKGVIAIAKETAELAAKAREGKLSPGEMQGGCFSISSLGGIGGTYFTPIINAPEVAIMGVCRSAMKPVWNGKEFTPRLTLPLSLSWDHRVIDGAAAARFNSYFAGLLADMRRAVL